MQAENETTAAILPAGEPPRYGMWPEIICGLMLILTVGRLMELLPFLKPLRLGMLSTAGAAGIALISGRLASVGVFIPRGGRTFALLAVAGAFSIPLSVWPGNAAQIWWGCFSMNIIILFVMCAVMRSRRSITLMSGFFVASVTVLAMGLTIFPSKLIVESGNVLRYGASDMYDPNDLALIMVTGIPIALARFFHAGWRGKPIWLIAAVLMGLGVLRTASRGGFIGLCVVGMLFVLGRTTRVSRPLKAALAIVAVAAVLLVSPRQLWSRMSAFVSGNDYNYTVSGEVDSAPGRLLIWQKAMGLMNPKVVLLGVGAGQFPVAMGNRYGRFFFMTAHNTFLQILGEMGLPALILFCMILLHIYTNNRAAKRIFSQAGDRSLMVDLPVYMNLSLIGFLVCAQLLSRGYSSLLPILLAFSMALRRLGDEESQAQPELPGQPTEPTR